jgi:zinc protease
MKIQPRFFMANLFIMLFLAIQNVGAAEDRLFSNSPIEPGGHEGAIAGLNVNIPQDIKLEFPVEKFMLSNGMTFLLHETHQIPMISYQTWFRVGSKDELPGESGLAHMLEHMMFKGAKKYTDKDFDRILHENGIINNAFTNFDYTGYYENLPSSKLELIMDVEVDRLMNLALTDVHLQKEREVVKEERRMRTDNNPEGIAWEKTMNAVFAENTYGIPVIGTMDDINAYTVEKLKKFFAKWYMPANAVVILVGDFDTNVARKLIKKYYGDLPGGKAPVHDKLAYEEPKESKIITEKFPVQAPEMMYGFKSVESGKEEGYALDLLANMLGQGKSSRLFQRVVYKDQVALNVGCGNYSLRDSGIFYLNVTLRPGQSIEKVKTIIADELKKIATQGVREDELQKVKHGVISDYVNSLQTVDGKARILALNEILFGDYTMFFRDLKKYRAVTVTDIKLVAQKYLKDSRQRLVIVEKGQ